MDRYIYYRAPVNKAAVLKLRVLHMHELISAQTGVRCEFKRQGQSHDGMHTWMEVYYSIPNDFSDQLHALEIQAELSSCTVGVRHVDDFFDCSELDRLGESS